MKHASKTSSTPPGTPRKCQRTQDLKTLLDTLNFWAMAPDSGQRTKALRGALRIYQQAVKGGRYPSIGKKICASTAACNELPAGDFVEFFGESEEGSYTRSTTKEMR